jgi:heme/copper-type cytochrome/quinol oxidase subunit 3
MGVYQADREVRKGRVRAAQLAANGVPSAPAVDMMPPAPTSELLAKLGTSEAPAALGLNNSKFGMWIFIASEVMFFTALIVTFVGFKAKDLISTPHLLNVILVGANTFILLLSSLTVVMALEAIQEGKRAAFRNYLIATAVLGAVFVGGQAFEWYELLHAEVTPSSGLFGALFFVITGFHGTHVLIGVLWVISLVVRGSALGQFSARDNLGIEIFGLYWHFVDIVWIILFTIIYLI